ncbi:MAG TPA: hypothetical protein VL048_19860 [Xanthobacteraceae bacterium]|nr:hypothetical protein [Xanthobacteraceae bacterium]
MTSPDEFRQYAEECLRWARQAQDEDTQKRFLELANAWTLAAAQLDGVAPVAPNVTTR